MLRLLLNPEGVSLGVSLNSPGDPFDLERVEPVTELAPQEMPAYGRVLVGVLEAAPALSIRTDEAEESRRIVEPILGARSENRVPLLEYPASSDGPGEAGIRPGPDRRRRLPQRTPAGLPPPGV